MRNDPDDAAVGSDGSDVGSTASLDCSSDPKFESTEPGLGSTAAATPSDGLSRRLPIELTPPPLGRLGGFELLEVLGRGNMGLVYLARDVRLDRRVALKRIREGRLDSVEDRLRFRAEAAAAARLDHPGIVPVYEVGEQDGLPYYAMAFVAGRTLAARIREDGPLDPEQAAEIARKVAEAVAAAHARDVIHRDLKPANVLLDEAGIPRITDFGLAKRLDTDSRLTQSDAILGSPSYMSPEQAEGRTGAVGFPTDLHAIGAILYEMLTGRPPFFGGSIQETLELVRHATPVAPRQLRPHLKRYRDLETITLKCLEKDPRHRYVSAQTLADDLGRFLRGESIAARPVPLWERAGRWTKRYPSTAALIGVLIASAALLIAIFGWSHGLDVRRRAEDLVRALETAETSRLETVRVEAESFGKSFQTALSERLASLSRDNPSRIRLRAAEVPLGAEGAAELYEAACVCDPMTLRFLLDALKKRTDPSRDAWLDALLKAGEPARRLRGEAALAAWAPRDPRWNDKRLVQVAAADLLNADRLEQGIWVELLRPVGRFLVEPLRAEMKAGRSSERALLAVRIAASYLGEDRPDQWVPLALDLDPTLAQELVGRIAAAGPSARVALEGALRDDSSGNGDAKSETRKLRAALLLLALGHDNAVAPLWRHGPDDTLRMSLMDLVARADPAVVGRLADRIVSDLDDSTRRALIQVLGEVPPSRLDPQRLEPTVKALMRLYAEDPDPGIHAASAWTLRRWGRAGDLAEVDAELADRKPPPDRRWRSAPNGHLMVLIPGPYEFTMGSNPTDPIRGADERAHRRRIGTGYALSWTETTLGQFRAFRTDHAEREEPASSDDLPAFSISYDDALDYCNWLSEQAVLPREQWCYPSRGERAANPDWSPDEGHRRQGFRLPTEAEWEAACRAGTETPWPTGRTETALDRIAWTQTNSEGRLKPVGLLRPNDWGLFDTLGNLAEWCVDGYTPYPSATSDQPILDAPVPLGPGLTRVMRGGDVAHHMILARCAARAKNAAVARNFYQGFRVARTLDDETNEHARSGMRE